MVPPGATSLSSGKTWKTLSPWCASEPASAARLAFASGVAQKQVILTRVLLRTVTVLYSGSFSREQAPKSSSLSSSTTARAGSTPRNTRSQDSSSVTKSAGRSAAGPGAPPAPAPPSDACGCSGPACRASISLCRMARSCSSSCCVFLGITGRPSLMRS